MGEGRGDVKTPVHNSPSVDRLIVIGSWFVLIAKYSDRASWEWKRVDIDLALSLTVWLKFCVVVMTC